MMSKFLNQPNCLHSHIGLAHRIFKSSLTELYKIYQLLQKEKKNLFSLE